MSSEELREIARDLRANIISVNDGVSAINLLLAKQQSEFDTIKNSGRKMYELGKKETQEEFVKKVEELKLTD